VPYSGELPVVGTPTDAQDWRHVFAPQSPHRRWGDLRLLDLGQNRAHGARAARQQIVATLGKEPGLESSTRRGWEEVVDLLEGPRAGAGQGRLGGRRSRRRRGRSGRRSIWRVCAWSECAILGRIYLALSLWRRLGLHTLLREIIAPGQE